METIFVLLPLALLIAAIAVGFFIWAARTGQFDDLETPARAHAVRRRGAAPAAARQRVRPPATASAESTRRVPE